MLPELNDEIIKEAIVAYDAMLAEGTLPFEIALALLKAGHTLSRKAWHKEGYDVRLEEDELRLYKPDSPSSPSKSKYVSSAIICEDILADDWYVV